MKPKTSQAKLTLPGSVFSPQDLAALILEVRGYARWASHNGVKQQLGQHTASQPPDMSAGAVELLRAWSGGKPLTAQSLDELINYLGDLKAGAPAITITLAAPPAKDIKSTLVAWCRQNIAPDVLVTFQFNSTLLGGMVVRIGSRVFDWSFRRQILEGRGRFAEVLRRV